MYDTGLRLNPMDLSATRISCVTSMIYFVYLMTRALLSDGYSPSSNSKDTR